MVHIHFEKISRWFDRYGNIFEKSKIFFPVNIQNYHWTLIVVDLERKTIQYFDSCYGDGSEYINVVKRYLLDKWKLVYKDDIEKLQEFESFENSQWEIINFPPNVPQQGDTQNCGVFLCLFADRISEGLEYNELQPEVLNTRGRMYILSCLKECVVPSNV